MKKTKHDRQFQISSSFTPVGDQKRAITQLTKNIHSGMSEQVLLGVTGSGKTFTMANVIQNIGKPTLICSHNKTLAAQLYQEFRDFFPTNAVSFFVSYYDYYQPEAYIPQSDTYIEKETEINDQIDKLRLAATMNCLTRPDTIIVASVSCIYNIGSPREYGHFVIEIQTGMSVTRESIIDRLVTLQYQRTNWDLQRGTFRVRGDIIDCYPAYEDTCIRMTISTHVLTKIERRHPVSADLQETLHAAVIYPAKHYMTNPNTYKDIFAKIEHDCTIQEALFRKEKKYIEAQRIHERVHHDLEMIREVGYVNGIENYSRYFENRKTGDPPFTLFDYFTEARNNTNDWLLFIDESHMTIPQIRGMYHGDRSRKQTLVDYGFRLPSALDNRPLTFDEFLRRIPTTIYVSATPDVWELSRANAVVEQLTRPTGLIDPKIEIRPTMGQIQNLIEEIEKRVQKNQRVMVTTITKQLSEDITNFLQHKGIRVQFLHSDIETLERSVILTDLRKGAFDVVVGVNLLREGLDLPEVSLVAILDADKQGFLRSKISLIQTMGRAARHIHGEVYLYADTVTPAMRDAVNEVNRRRKYQVAYNKRNHIHPTSIVKPIRNPLVNEVPSIQTLPLIMPQNKLDAMTPMEKEIYKRRLKRQMHQAAAELDFELAASLRDAISVI